MGAGVCAARAWPVYCPPIRSMHLKHCRVVDVGGSHMNAKREQASLHLTATSDSFWPELLEAQALRQLHQYCWLHKRFKLQPAGEADF